MNPIVNPQTPRSAVATAVNTNTAPMTPKVEAQTPHAFCCICHQSTLESLDKVCWSCGSAFCTKHGQPDMITKFLGWLAYQGLDLDGVPATEMVLCPQCQLDSFHPRRLLPMLGALGRRLLPIRLSGDFAWFRMPVKPDMRIRINEYLRGAVLLNADGAYTKLGESRPAEMAQTNARLVVSMNLVNRDRERWEVVRNRYHLPFDANVQLQAGFLVLQPLTNLYFAPGNQPVPAIPAAPPATTPTPPPQQAASNPLPAPPPSSPGEQIVALPVIRHEPHEFLNGTPNTGGTTWNFERHLVVKRIDNKPIPLPVQIMPTLVQDDSHQSLELQVQLRPDIGRWLDFESANIDLLILRFPAELGIVQQTRPARNYPPSRLSNGGGVTYQTVVWKGGGLKANEPRATYHVRFNEKLSAGMSFTGRLNVVFDGALSQVKGVAAYSAWGHLLKTQPKFERRTHVSIRFQLTLSPLAVQWRLYHNPKGTYSLSQVAPDTEFMIVLEKVLSERSFNGHPLYVRKVVENPEQVNPTDALAANQFWEIEGRTYHGALPIDFMLKLWGTSYQGRPQLGKTNYDIATQAMVSSNEVEARVRDLHDQLQKAVDATRDQILQSRRG
jgi:hypothetical protein